jgi:lipopolysaccharide/colanic/teichoic acid biosynthesis glycosyltransferase
MSGIPRAVEMALALCGLVVFSPLLFLLAVLIRSTSPGPIFFRQPRVGRFGKPFELVKFRSMHVQNRGPQVTAKGDIRVTRLGRLLRKSKLDELPELWNVARGDLSLVGPRPEVCRYVDLENPLWQKVLESRPGITDPVTLRLRNEEEFLSSCEGDLETFYVSTLQPYKLLGYTQYLQHRSWRSDINVLLETVCGVLFKARAAPPRLEEIVGVVKEYRGWKEKDLLLRHERAKARHETGTLRRL